MFFNQVFNVWNSLNNCNIPDSATRYIYPLDFFRNDYFMVFLYSVEFFNRSSNSGNNFSNWANASVKDA